MSAAKERLVRLDDAKHRQSVASRWNSSIMNIDVILMQKARIKLSSPDPKKLEGVCSEIKSIADKFGVALRGPIPLPTKKLKVVTMKTPCGDGTGHGNASWDRFEMRIHKRVIDVGADERTLRQIMRVTIPDGVSISIELKD